MSGIARTLVLRTAPVFRTNLIQTRGIRSAPPKTPLTLAEKFIGMGVISAGCLVIPGYIMSHLDVYKARE
jgi:hypothetical protein